MNTNEDIRNDASNDVIVLGVASVETKGLGSGNEPGSGLGKPMIPGISEE